MSTLTHCTTALSISSPPRASPLMFFGPSSRPVGKTRNTPPLSLRHLHELRPPSHKSGRRPDPVVHTFRLDGPGGGAAPLRPKRPAVSKNLRRGRRDSRPIRPILVRQLAVRVSVMVPNPSHRKRQLIFVPTLWHIIEIIVCAHRHLRAPRVSRIRVEDVSGLVLVEHADARPLFARERRHLIVVVHLAARLLLLGERHVIIPVEVIPVRRHPRKAPFHALLERFDLWQCRPRNRREIGRAHV